MSPVIFKYVIRIPWIIWDPMSYPMSIRYWTPNLIPFANLMMKDFLKSRTFFQIWDPYPYLVDRGSCSDHTYSFRPLWDTVETQVLISSSVCHCGTSFNLKPDSVPVLVLRQLDRYYPMCVRKAEANWREMMCNGITKEVLKAGPSLLCVPSNLRCPWLSFVERNSLIGRGITTDWTMS